MFFTSKFPELSKPGTIAAAAMITFALSGCNFLFPTTNGGSSDVSPLSDSETSVEQTTTIVDQTTTTSTPDASAEKTRPTFSAEDLAGISADEQELLGLINELRADPNGQTGGRAAECQDWDGNPLPALELAPKIAVNIAEPQANRQSVGFDGTPILTRYDDSDLAEAKALRPDLNITWMDDLLSAVAEDPVNSHLKEWTDSQESLCWLINDQITHAAPAIVSKSANTLAGSVSGTVASFTILITE